MLALSRKEKESFVLVLEDGTVIHELITMIDRGKVTVAFDAPSSVKIYRKEIYDKIQKEGTNDSES